MAWSKESRQSRGYGAAWDRRRILVLKRDNYICHCDECIRSDRVRPATQVDHRIPKAKGGTDAMENLCAINADCHNLKTALENNRPQKPRIGLDGYPIWP